MDNSLDSRLLIAFSDLIKAFYQNKSEQLASLNMKGSHCKVLHLIHDHDGASQHEILKIASITKSTMSEIITEMEYEGYIYKKQMAKDKRQTAIFLTPEGEKRAQFICDCFNEYCMQFFSDFNKDEFSIFMELLKKIKY